MKNIKDFIKDWFIDLDFEKIPSSYFIIRGTLLNAVTELKPKLRGDVLDLGCGIMPYRDFLNSSAIDNYIGVDLYEPTSYQNLVKPDLFWDGVTIPMDDSSCDYVLATEFLEHYYDTNHILLEIKRVLKKNGTLFFTVPSIWPLHESPNDYHRFTPFSLDRHFQNSGYSSWEIKALGGLHVAVSIILSLWLEKIPSKRKRTFLGFFLRGMIKFLLKRDKKMTSFQNGQLYSGLYGYVVK